MALYAAINYRSVKGDNITSSVCSKQHGFGTNARRTRRMTKKYSKTKGVADTAQRATPYREKRNLDGMASYDTSCYWMLECWNDISFYEECWM